jgi:hypothetical protein
MFVACPLCELRKPKRYCPAKAEMICAVCCGEKREVTIDCPSDCSYLIASRRWEREHRKPITVADVPYPDLSIPMEVIHAQQPIVSGLGYTVLKAAVEIPSVDDSGAIEALTALAETYRTLGTGLYYERPPDGPAARAVYMHLTQFIAELRQAEQKQAAFGGVKDSEIFRLAVFLLRVAKYETNGRPRSRAFLDFLQAQFPRAAEDQAEPSRIIVP